MSLGWEVLDRRARNGDVTGVSSLLLKATEEERLVFAKEVETRLKTMKPEDWWRAKSDPSGGYGLAVIGTMPSAARAAALLCRRDLRDKWGQIPIRHAVALVRARELPWLGDLGGRLAARLTEQDTWSGGWQLVAALLSESGTTPPVTEGVVRCWLDEMQRTHWDAKPVATVDRFRDSPYLDLLLPALFEFDGLGAELNRGSWDAVSGTWEQTPAFPDAVTQLVAEGRLERKAILDATVDRLVRGDRPARLRPFALLHDALAPSVDELAGHALDYARMLPDAPSAVAGLAQRALRAVDDAGRLELETLLEISWPTLVRKEKTLVKDQLIWLDRVARRDPDRAGEVLETVAAAFGHPALDIQERALTLIGRHIGRLDAGTLAGLADAAVALGGELPARAAELFGVTEPLPAAVVAELLPPPPPAPMPPPIDSAVELAAEVAALLHEETAVRWERVLAGLVSLRAGGDTAALAAALGPLLDRYAHAFAENRWLPRPHVSFLGAAIRAIVDPAAVEELRRGRWYRLLAAVRTAWHGDGDNRPILAGAPDRLLPLRVAELYARLEQTPVPLLVATPTQVNGSLDAATLARRLRRAEAEGWQPWPLDLEQALLRLPRTTGPEAAAGLTSSAGRQLAEWLAGGGLPDPMSTRFEQRAGETRPYYIGPPPAVGRVVVNLTPARAGRLRVEEELLTLRQRPVLETGASEQILDPGILAATLPHHREVSAAWALPGLAALADQDERGGATLLPLLAGCTGPIGPAMSLAMAYVLGARHESDRVAAVDAFLILAAGAEPFAAAVGRDLGDLAGRGMVKLNRAVPALTDAHRASASPAVWDVLAAALPPLLPRAPRGLPDLLELATQVAGTTGAKDQIPHLAETAVRKGSSRLIKEARRLQSLLTR